MNEYWEYRIQADHSTPAWSEMPPYDFTFSEWRGWARREGESAEEAAAHLIRPDGHFIRSVTNVRVTRRRVLVSDWEDLP